MIKRILVAFIAVQFMVLPAQANFSELGSQTGTIDWSLLHQNWTQSIEKMSDVEIKEMLIQGAEQYSPESLPQLEAVFADPAFDAKQVIISYYDAEFARAQKMTDDPSKVSFWKKAWGKVKKGGCYAVKGVGAAMVAVAAVSLGLASIDVVKALDEGTKLDAKRFAILGALGAALGWGGWKVKKAVSC